MLWKGLINSVSVISVTVGIYLLGNNAITRGLDPLLLCVWLDYWYSMDCEGRWLHALFQILVWVFCQDKCSTGVARADMTLNLPPPDLFWCCDNFLCRFSFKPNSVSLSCVESDGLRDVTHLISSYTDVADISQCRAAMIQIHYLMPPVLKSIVSALKLTPEIMNKNRTQGYPGSPPCRVCTPCTKAVPLLRQPRFDSSLWTFAAYHPPRFSLCNCTDQ